MSAGPGFWSNGWVIPALFGLLMGLLGYVIGWLASGQATQEKGQLELRRGSLFTGFLLILLGLFFFIDRNLYPLDLGNIIRHGWPLILVMLGLGMLFRRSRHGAEQRHWSNWHTSREKGETS